MNYKGDSPSVIPQIDNEITANEDEISMKAINQPSAATSKKHTKFLDSLQQFITKYPTMSDDERMLSLLSVAKSISKIEQFDSRLPNNPFSLDIFQTILINTIPIEINLYSLIKIATFISLNYKVDIPIFAETNFLDYIHQYLLKKQYSDVIIDIFKFLTILVHNQPDCIEYLFEHELIFYWLDIIFNFDEMEFEMPITITEKNESTTQMSDEDRYNFLFHGLAFVLEVFPLFPDDFKIEFFSKEEFFLNILQNMADLIIIKEEKHSSDADSISEPFFSSYKELTSSEDDDIDENLSDSSLSIEDNFVIQTIKLFRQFCDFCPDHTAHLLTTNRQPDHLDQKIETDFSFNGQSNTFESPIDSRNTILGTTTSFSEQFEPKQNLGTIKANSFSIPPNPSQPYFSQTNQDQIDQNESSQQPISENQIDQNESSQQPISEDQIDQNESSQQPINENQIDQNESLQQHQGVTSTLDDNKEENCQENYIGEHGNIHLSADNLLTVNKCILPCLGNPTLLAQNTQFPDFGNPTLFEANSQLDFDTQYNGSFLPVSPPQIQPPNLIFKNETFLYYFMECRRYTELSPTQFDLLHIINDLFQLDFDEFYSILIDYGLGDFLSFFFRHSEIRPKVFFDVTIFILFQALPDEPFRHNTLENLKRLLRDSETRYEIKFNIILSYAYMILGKDVSASILDRIVKEIDLIPDLFLVLDEASDENAVILLNAIKRLIENAINQGEEQEMREYLNGNDLNLEDYQPENEIEYIMIPLEYINNFIKESE